MHGTVDDDEAAAIASLKERSVVLDVGCGDGSLQHLLNVSHRADVTSHAVDINKSMHLPKKVIFTRVDLEAGKLPFDDESFDLIYCSHVIEHLTNALDVLDDIVRCLKVGGELIIRVPSERSISGRSFGLPVRRNFIGNFYDDPTHIGRPWSPQSLYRYARYKSLAVCHCKYNTSLIAKILFPFALIWGVLSKNTDLIVDWYWRCMGWESYARLKRVQQDVSFNYYSFKGRS